MGKYHGEARHRGLGSQNGWVPPDTRPCSLDGDNKAPGVFTRYDAMGITYGCENNNEILMYADADYTTDLDEHSTLFLEDNVGAMKMANNPVSSHTS